MNLIPIGDNVMLVFPQTGRLEDGVWVDAGTSDRMDATVVAVGPRVKSLSVGDTVVADRMSGIELIDEGVSYRIIPEKAVEARMEV